MIVLSLFDGISTGHLALNDAGIKVSTYYASEINPYATKITNTRFPDTVQLGDINLWKQWNIEWNKIDLILAGSPCQDLSFAGSKTGLTGSKSSLFFVFLDILNFVKIQNPNVLFLLENVKMKQENLKIITEALGVIPVRINSNLVSAQNRDRYYWTNINNGIILQPKDCCITLKDILRKEDDGKYPLTTTHMNAFIKNYPNWKICSRDGKAKPILATYYKQPPHCPYIEDTLSESGVRRLSPEECELCQTLPIGYTKVDGISDTRRYESIGNGWTMKIISHILSYIKNLEQK